ncbi:hypothetical protein BTA51_20570 [Hahella sp. CCB-MM4]|uniref:hypothetical protein n=1 Tax=Hahella sp. (strain CCB-MM4) TaxID=1926491 RepID=UPI000B9B6FDC|nr:hypothetical protein [Hahella sp. CCB-MM4]OZG71349.1 hypothetical protein BTA51_20570 [Hahella sp. CCB-MM4]
MKKFFLAVLLAVGALAPTMSYAKGVPLFFQTGDELFEIDGAPTFEDGYSVGYACQRFALLGADVWTWDCDLMAINVEEFSAGDLDDEYKAELSQQYSLSDRKRNPWNHYGIFALSALFIGGAVLKTRK